MCKGADKKVGLRVQAINKGIFVCVVVKNSPAALAGLRFGDQILQINGTLVAGFSVDDVHKLLKKSDKNNISVVVRDRYVHYRKSMLGKALFCFQKHNFHPLTDPSSVPLHCTKIRPVASGSSLTMAPLRRS